MYGWTSWHQGRPDQKTQVCDSSRMAWNGGRGETEWPISPAGNPFLPREALQMLISKDCETLCLMPFFYLLHAVFLLDLLTLFHICYSNSGENLEKSSSVCLFCPNLAPKTDENFSQWWWCSLQDISTPNGGYIHHKIPQYLILWGGILVIRIGFLSSKWWFWLSADCNLINCYFYQQPLYNHNAARE